MKYLKIKDLPRIERPREKLQRYKPDKLSNAELFALILRTGSKNIDVMNLSRNLVKEFPEKSITKANIKQLTKIPGFGLTKASQIIAVFELGRRFFQDKNTTLIMRPKDVFDQLKMIRGRNKEHFIVIYLNTRHQQIKKEVISIGSLNMNVIHPREVFEPAVKHMASQIILAHNHPSGDTEPSDEDIIVTKRLVKAGKLLGIDILDHIIISKDSFTSMKDRLLI